MTKITEKRIDDYVGTVYLYSLGYGYKIKYKKTVIDQSYAYLTSKQDAINKMEWSLKVFAKFNKSLLDLL